MSRSIKREALHTGEITDTARMSKINNSYVTLLPLSTLSTTGILSRHNVEFTELFSFIPCHIDQKFKREVLFMNMKL